jgi:hypothetical protein
MHYVWRMKTTLTIDDDVAAALERLRCHRDADLKDLVDEALRRGLSEMEAQPKSAFRFGQCQWIAARH